MQSELGICITAEGPEHDAQEPCSISRVFHGGRKTVCVFFKLIIIEIINYRTFPKIFGQQQEMAMKYSKLFFIGGKYLDSEHLIKICMY